MLLLVCCVIVNIGIATLRMVWKKWFQSHTASDIHHLLAAEHHIHKLYCKIFKPRRQAWRGHWELYFLELKMCCSLLTDISACPVSVQSLYKLLFIDFTSIKQTNSCNKIKCFKCFKLVLNHQYLLRLADQPVYHWKSFHMVTHLIATLMFTLSELVPVTAYVKKEL